MEKLVPKEHGEEMAVFQSQLIGRLVHRVLTRGQPHPALAGIARQAVRPPGRVRTRQFSLPALQRWYYRVTKSGVAGCAGRPPMRERARTATVRAVDPFRRQAPPAIMSALFGMRSWIFHSRRRPVHAAAGALTGLAGAYALVFDSRNQSEPQRGLKSRQPGRIYPGLRASQT